MASKLQGELIKIGLANEVGKLKTSLAKYLMISPMYLKSVEMRTDHGRLKKIEA